MTPGRRRDHVEAVVAVRSIRAARTTPTWTARWNTRAVVSTVSVADGSPASGIVNAIDRAAAALGAAATARPAAPLRQREVERSAARRAVRADRASAGGCRRRGARRRSALQAPGCGSAPRRRAAAPRARPRGAAGNRTTVAEFTFEHGAGADRRGRPLGRRRRPGSRCAAPHLASVVRDRSIDGRAASRSYVGGVARRGHHSARSALADHPRDRSRAARRRPPTPCAGRAADCCRPRRSGRSAASDGGHDPDPQRFGRGVRAQHPDQRASSRARRAPLRCRRSATRTRWPAGTRAPARRRDPAPRSAARRPAAHPVPAATRLTRTAFRRPDPSTAAAGSGTLRASRACTAVGSGTRPLLVSFQVTRT